MDKIKVLIHGVAGRMGSEVLAAVCKEPGIEPVAGVDKAYLGETLSLPDGSGALLMARNIHDAIATTSPDVVVDFTNAEGSMVAAREAAAMGVNIVVGSTGITDSHLAELDGLGEQYKVGIFMAPNFAIGAALMIHLAKSLGRYFDYADVIEMHHEAKIDSPSGTAIALAGELRSGRNADFVHPDPEREPIEGSRGGQFGGISIHSIRMPGRMAHHEVLLGTSGQTFSLRHDTINRECYMPGVILAIREVMKYDGLKIGLDKLLDL